MKLFKSAILLFISIVFLQSCYEEFTVKYNDIPEAMRPAELIWMNGKNCAYDEQNQSLRYTIEKPQIEDFAPHIDFHKKTTVYFEEKKLDNRAVNHFGEIQTGKVYQLRIETKKAVQNLTLTFTTLPIVQLVVPAKIVDEPKTPGTITLNYPEEDKAMEQFYVGIEHRGGTSQTYDKKSFGLSFKTTPEMDENISVSLFGMKKNNDWILDAMWIDRARLRNKTCFQLWKQMEGEKNQGIESEFVELYINNEHRGLYCLNEKVNAELLDLKEPEDVLYKCIRWKDGAALFESLNSDPVFEAVWDSWEQKHPDPEQIINWQPLYDLRQLVVYGNDETFVEQITDHIHLDNFVDYYIFLNLVMAEDNTGKNTFLTKQSEDDKLFIVPWDLDASFGIHWEGSYSGWEGRLSNNLFDRLIQNKPLGFDDKLKKRWQNLRTTVFTDALLIKSLNDNFHSIKKSGVINIENEKWALDIAPETEQQYLLDWLEKRLAYMDTYFENL